MFSRSVSVVYKIIKSALNRISAGNINCCNLSLLDIKPLPRSTHLLQPLCNAQVQDEGHSGESLFRASNAV